MYEQKRNENRKKLLVLLLLLLLCLILFRSIFDEITPERLLSWGQPQ